MSIFNNFFFCQFDSFTKLLNHLNLFQKMKFLLLVYNRPQTSIMARIQHLKIRFQHHFVSVQYILPELIWLHLFLPIAFINHLHLIIILIAIISLAFHIQFLLVKDKFQVGIYPQ